MLEIFASYVVGTIVGLWLTRSYRSNVVDTVIEALIDQQSHNHEYLNLPTSSNPNLIYFLTSQNSNNLLDVK